jgi:hypothetical protein
MIVLSAMSVAAGASPISPVGWLQLPSDCAPLSPAAQSPKAATPDDRQTVLCGSAGTFVFGRTSLPDSGGCEPLASGFEPPELFPADPAPHLPASFPCAQGRCLRHTPGTPWVALLDWPTAHGWSVAAAVQEAADQQVEVALYDLTDAGALSTWVPPVSDLHVLFQLCAVAQAAQEHPADRPLAVNLSFGRLDTPADCTAAGSSLPLRCAIDSVLTHLAADGIVPVAAAGNHQKMLFPASSPSAVSAGALDLSYLQQSGKPRASTQTPAAAEALMLGYGLYLSLDGAVAASGGDPVWPAPPGSSYAAALLSGWLSGIRAGGGSLPPLTDGDRLAPLATASGLALALNSVPLAGSELQGPQRLLDRALHFLPPTLDPQLGADLALTGAAPPLPEEPLLYAAAGSGPQPGIDPCVPCRGNGQAGGMGEGSGTVLIDLSASGGLPSSIAPVAVFLRVGKSIYRFDLSRDPDLLTAFAAGQLDSLTLSGVDGIFKAGEQPSLVLVVNIDGLAYWHEVPLHMPR